MRYLVAPLIAAPIAGGLVLVLDVSMGPAILIGSLVGIVVGLVVGVVTAR